jgi:quercetin dioxygenase-like cupin family protein
MTLDRSFEDFERDMRLQGFETVIEKQWPPHAVVDTHVHPFAAKALVVQGEMWLTVGDVTQHLRPGSTFELEHEQPHAERYGHEGATYWVARRGADAPVG